MDFELQIKERAFSSTSQQPYSLFLSPPPLLSSSQSTDFNLNNKISPSILLIIIILAVIFFISGLLHLLVRFLFRPPNRNPNEIDHTALQGQLQQLFHLHDSGVDQSFIDTLPVFSYKAIAGAKDPFDCAVCLSEFEVEDKLRLLPKCSHAFHMSCIDTWLLSHSTCPLCRASLVADFAHSSPVVRILESGSESSRERVGLSTHYDGAAFRVSVEEPKSSEIRSKEDDKVVLVKLGKFRNVGGHEEEEGSSERRGEVRRCYSMGSFAYIMDENSSLKVAICSEKIKGNIRSERDSFSISKIWLRGRKDEPNEARTEESRRAFSFRFPVAAGESNTKSGGGGDGRSVSEIEGQCNSLDCEKDHPSFGRRTLLWFMGKAK